MPRVIRIDHVAVLVEDTEDALRFWRDGLGLELQGLRDVPAEHAQIAFLPVGESEVELVKAITEDSGLARYLAKRGPGMHHLCLEVDDIEGMLERLKERGVELINQEPRTGAGGKRYAFIHPRSAQGVMVELYELPPLESQEE